MLVVPPVYTTVIQGTSRHCMHVTYIFFLFTVNIHYFRAVHTITNDNYYYNCFFFAFSKRFYCGHILTRGCLLITRQFQENVMIFTRISKILKILLHVIPAVSRVFFIMNFRQLFFLKIITFLFFFFLPLLFPDISCYYTFFFLSLLDMEHF